MKTLRIQVGSQETGKSEKWEVVGFEKQIHKEYNNNWVRIPLNSFS